MDRLNDAGTALLSAVRLDMRRIGNRHTFSAIP